MSLHILPRTLLVLVFVLFNEVDRVRFAGKAVFYCVLSHDFSHVHWLVVDWRWVFLQVQNVSFLVCFLHLRASKAEGTTPALLELIFEVVRPDIVARWRRVALSGSQLFGAGGEARATRAKRSSATLCKR